MNYICDKHRGQIKIQLPNGEWVCPRCEDAKSKIDVPDFMKEIFGGFTNAK